jgi:hypothetical protein
MVFAPGGVGFGLATTSVAARGAGLGGLVGVFSGPAGMGFARFGSVVEAPPGDAARLSSVGGVLLLVPHKRMHVGVQVRGRRLGGLFVGLTRACHAWLGLRRRMWSMSDPVSRFGSNCMND